MKAFWLLIALGIILERREGGMKDVEGIFFSIMLILCGIATYFSGW